MGDIAARLDDLGTTIAGRYLIEEALGGGGMAAVYKVLDQRTGKRVALKRGWRGVGNRSAKRKELLEREFYTLAQLAHPRIIEVYDYGVDDAGPYYTMELLDGADLHRGGKLPWKQACALLCDVASSLALLHSRGLIHRDVSARNVRCTADGRAKLIDFGAMTPAGVARDVVGTPPFLAPEVLQMQALDGRADLFSLGALGYYMLTGQHAYPARRFRDLRDAWRSRPTPPRRLAPDVPAALDGLILQLLALDRGARLHSAAEAMQRLGTIAGLALEEGTQVSRAYLTSPGLVGRETMLVAVRRRMLSLARGDGGSLLIHGPPGSGRSRLLDACALEAKMMGAAVLRADASDERSDWGVARVLGTQLVQLMPEQAQEVARRSRDVLGQVLDGLRPEGSGSASGLAGERSILIRELRDFILALARLQRLVIVVDDADRIDEPSAALLAAIAHKTERHPLILAIAVNPDTAFGSSAPMRLLHLVSDRIGLPPLQIEQTEALLRTVFGEVPHLEIVAGRIQALSLGNPRTIMELAQHLVDRGLARYEAGSWSLPQQLGALPDSLSASLAARIASLPPDAREICEALSVADADAEDLTLTDHIELTAHRDQRRAFAAIDELIVARVLSGDSERYRFSQRGFVAVVEQMLSEPRRQWLHGRVADTLTRSGGDVLRRVHHLLRSGRDLEAVELLGTVDLKQRSAPLVLLEAALASAERHALPARTIHELRRALVVRAALDMATTCFRDHIPRLLAELERDAGLVRYHELADVPEPERLTRALMETQQRHDALPAHARVHSVPDAIRALAALCGVQRGVALTIFDKALLEALPSLAPLVAISPAIQLGEWSGQAHRDTLIGRFTRARAGYERVLRRLSEPDAAGLAPEEHARVTFGAHYVLGLIDAGRGLPSAEEHAAALEVDRAYRVNGWRIRMLWQLTLGDADEAARCRRRAELTLLQEGGTQHYAGTSGLGELVCHVLTGDLLAIRQACDAVSQLAERFPGWRPFLSYGQAHALVLSGDPGSALELVEGALANVRPAEHAAFPYLASTHVIALNELGRCEEAAMLGRDYIAICEREELTPTAYVVHVAAALALGRSQAFDEAIGVIEQVIAIARARNQRGIGLGTMYEARARIGSWMRDEPAFQEYSELCAVEYQHGRNAVLAARLARLRDDARGAGGSGYDSSSPPAMDGSDRPTASEFATVHSRMLECVDEGDRARCALTLLLQQLDSFGGYLYGVDDRRHRLLAAVPEDEVDPQLDRWFGRYLAEELAPDDAERKRARAPFRYVDSSGRAFEPLFLSKPEGLHHRLAAVLVYHAGSDRRRPSRELQSELAEQLLEHGDVSGAVLDVAGTQTRTR